MVESDEGMNEMVCLPASHAFLPTLTHNTPGKLNFKT